MANKIVVNTFTGGINKDIDKALLPKTSYLDAQNFRAVTSVGNSTGSLETIKGNKVISNTIVATGQFIIGSCEIRDRIILFTTSNKGSAPGVSEGTVTTNGTTTLVGTLSGFTNGAIGGTITVSGETVRTIATIIDDTHLTVTVAFSTTASGLTYLLSAGRSMIYSLTIDIETETQTALTVLYDDNLNTDSSYLTFSTVYPIKTVARYETPNVQKVYWTDGYNNMRFVNIIANLTVDGEVYVSAGDYMSVDKFEFLPEFEPVKPVLKDIVGGEVNTGVVAYAYQLYIIYGAETAFSPLSDPIHVVSDNDFLTNTKVYKGDSESINSGKGFILEIDNTANVGYNRFRLIRVHYANLNSVPSITIANEIEISTAGSIVRITDTGDTLGELTIDEFNISSTELFTCQDIASKDNKLFVSNITKSEFTVDAWDARVVRFKSAIPPIALVAGTPTAGGLCTPGTHSYKVTFTSVEVEETTGGATSNQITCVLTTGQTVPLSAVPIGPTGTLSRKIYRTVAGDTGSYLLLATIGDNITTVYSDIIADGSLGAVIPGSATTTAKISDVVQGDKTILADLSNWDNPTTGYKVDHDGINKFNDTNYDGNIAYQWMYQADGTTLGAEGKNIKIDFETELIYLDTSNSNTTFYATSPSSSTDKSYGNYASPWKGGKLSWQRDEVYRLFAEFGNTRGQISDPQWMCDLRMPSLHDADFTNASGLTVKPSSLAIPIIPTYAYGTYRIYPRVYFKNFPTNATFARIYRVKRDRVDRSVVTQGLAIPSYLSDGVYYTDQAITALPNNGEIIKLVSPEINITRNISKQGNDYIEYVTNYGSSYTTTEVRTSLSSLNMGHIIKLKANTRVPFTTATVTNIDDAIIVSPSVSSTSDLISIDSKSFSNYAARINIDGKGSTGLTIAYSDSSWSAETVRGVIVNYRSRVFGSQYGGNTYEDRQLNVSMPCSDIIKPTAVGTWVDVSYGDTFINYFDVSTILADLTAATYHDTWTESVYIPLESSINCDLRHSESDAHLFKIPTAYDDYAYYLRQEYLGNHTIDTDELIYKQTKDLYLYNTVYSQQVDIKYAISLVTDKILETEFDCMIKASNSKHSGEITDSWTKFGVNEYIEVDPINGPVNAIYNFNNHLFYWQDKAFGMTSVNDRSLINDNASAQLVLGTGGVLDRFDYISEHTGCMDKFSIVSSLSGLYWFDRLSKSIYKYSNNLLNLSKIKFIQSFLDTTIDSNFTVIAHADRNNNEILFTFIDVSVTNSHTISFNEPMDVFVSFYGFIPSMYIPYKNWYLTTTSSDYCGADFDRNYLFLHDSILGDRCYFYALTAIEADKYVDSTLEILFNPDYSYTKVFDNLFYISSTASKTVSVGPVKSGNIDTFADTFNTVQCYNDFQNTGETTLTPQTNIERRERGWTLVVPRNIVNANISTNPNIFTAVDATQLFKERMRDKYLIAYFKYENDGTYDRFIISNMGLRYRISIR